MSIMSAGRKIRRIFRMENKVMGCQSSWLIVNTENKERELRLGGEGLVMTGLAVAIPALQFLAVYPKRRSTKTSFGQNVVSAKNGQNVVRPKRRLAETSFQPKTAEKEGEMHVAKW